MTKAKRSERDEFVLARRRFLGGTDRSAVHGHSPYGNVLTVVKDKTDPPEELLKRQRNTPETRRGTIMEPAVLQEYMLQTGAKVRRRREPIIHPNFPFIGGNVDGLADKGRTIVEAKTVPYFKDADKDGNELWGPEGTDRIPRHYWWQCVHYLDCRPESWKVRLVAMDWYLETRVYEVKRDDLVQEVIDYSRGVLVDVWQTYIEPRLKGIPTPYPVPEAHLANIGMPPAKEGERTDLWMVEDIVDIAKEYYRQRRIMREAEKLSDNLKGRLIEAVGEAEFGELNGQTLYRARNGKRRSLDTRALQEFLKAEGVSIPDGCWRDTSWRQIDVDKSIKALVEDELNTTENDA